MIKHNILELEDISKIVHDVNSGEIIGENQWSMIIDFNNCEVVKTNKFDFSPLIKFWYQKNKTLEQAYHEASANSRGFINKYLTTKL